MHDVPGDDHDHDMRDLEDQEDSPFYKIDTITLTSVGIDIGTATSQVIFSRLFLRRMGKELSSRFVVAERDTIYLSPVFWTLGMWQHKWFFPLLAANPVTDLLELFHGPLYWGQWPQNLALGGGPLTAWTVATSFVAIIFFGGYTLFDRSKRILAEVV